MEKEIHNKHLQKINDNPNPDGKIYSELLNFIQDCLIDYEHYYILYFLNNYLEYKENIDFVDDYFFQIQIFLNNAKIVDKERKEILALAIENQIDEKYLSYLKKYI